MHRRLLILVLALYAALAIGYSVASPPFETPDEHLHYFTADFIARHGRLPTTADAGPMGQEAAQPPLYYAAAALLIRALDRDGEQPVLWSNDHVDVSSVAGNVWISPLAPPNPRGESGARPPINANMFIRVPAEQWPWRGYVLAVHGARLLSAVLGLGTLLCLYAAGRVVWPDAPGRALLATALVAFLPQFAFIHAAVSNDAAITFFSAAAMWLLLRIVVGARGRPRSPAPLLFLGFTVGLAMLSKAAGVLLLAYCAAVVGLLALWAARREARGWGPALGRAAVAVAWVAGPALALGGWLLWRNWTLYGDPTAANQFVAIAGGYRPYSLLQVAQDLDRVWLSFFALFGWMSVQPPAWVHLVWNGIVLAALLGAGAALVRGRRAAGLRSFLARHVSFFILLGWLALVAAGWLQFMLRTSADQGRLFFPALVPLALAAAYGLSRWPRPAAWLAAGLALATSVYCLLAVLPPAFARPATVAAVPAAAAPLDYRFDEGLELLGARVETATARPGDWVWLTLYWRAPGGTAAAPLVYLELFGRGFARIGNVAAYHGRGGYPAALWPAGAIIADRLAVQARPDDPAALPVEARLSVKLNEDADSRDVGEVKIVPARWPARAAPLAALGAGIELAAAELATATAAPGDAVAVRLRWQVAAAPGPADLHLFIHLGDPAQAPLAQSDGPVMGGDYPARLWAAGEVFDETATLTLPAGLPPGDYPVQIGLYDFATGARLPVTAGGQRSPSDTVPLGVLRVR